MIKLLFLEDSSSLWYSNSFSILLHYFSDPSLMEGLSHYIEFPSHLHRTVFHHPTLHSSMCPIKHILWLSMNGSGWEYCSKVFFTLMQLGKLLQCIQCGGGSFSLRYFYILIFSVRAWSLSSLLESLGRLPKSTECLLDWYSFGSRRVTSSNLSPPFFSWATIYSGASPVFYSSSDASPLTNRT